MRKNAGQVSLLSLVLILCGAGLLLLHLGLMQAELSWLSFHRSCHQLLSQGLKSPSKSQTESLPADKPKWQPGPRVMGSRAGETTRREMRQRLVELRKSLEALPHIQSCSLDELSTPADLQAQCVWKSPWRDLLGLSPAAGPRFEPRKYAELRDSPQGLWNLAPWTDWGGTLTRQLQCRSPKANAGFQLGEFRWSELQDTAWQGSELQLWPELVRGSR